jgi:predicted dehydrogenase
MIHDIDIILSLVKANVKRISASGVAVISRNPDIANARIEFDNGCVANITASRISMKQMRKIRLFQPNSYLSIDLLEKKSEVFTLSDSPPTEESPALQLETGNMGETKYIRYEEPAVGEVNAIKMELELFRDAINNDTEPPVTLTDGYHALDVALQVMKKIENLGVNLGPGALVSL